MHAQQSLLGQRRTWFVALLTLATTLGPVATAGAQAPGATVTCATAPGKPQLIADADAGRLKGKYGHVCTVERPIVGGRSAPPQRLGRTNTVFDVSMEWSLNAILPSRKSLAFNREKSNTLPLQAAFTLNHDDLPLRPGAYRADYRLTFFLHRNTVFSGPSECEQKPVQRASGSSIGTWTRVQCNWVSDRKHVG